MEYQIINLFNIDKCKLGIHHYEFVEDYWWVNKKLYICKKCYQQNLK